MSPISPATLSTKLVLGSCPLPSPSAVPGAAAGGEKSPHGGTGELARGWIAICERTEPAGSAQAVGDSRRTMRSGGPAGVGGAGTPAMGTGEITARDVAPRRAGVSEGPGPG